MHGIDTFVPQFATTLKGTRIVVTPDLISEILPDYPSCQRLRNVSKDKVLSHFCETPSIWGERQNTPCSSFAKCPRFLDMVMTFVLTPLSYYNSMTEPRARFFYPSQRISPLTSLFISLSLSQMFIAIWRLVISSSFLQLSHESFTIFPSLFLILHTTLSWVPSTQRLFDRARPSFHRSSH